MASSKPVLLPSIDAACRSETVEVVLCSTLDIHIPRVVQTAGCPPSAPMAQI